MENNRYAVGIDLGGTFIKFALVAGSGEILYNSKLSIGSSASRDVVLGTIRKAIRLTIDAAKENNVEVAGIGIGSQGICYEGTVIGGADNLNGWSDVRLSAIFSEEFNIPVFIDNDANVMGLGETIYGAARDCTNVIYITVGTGIEGAIVAGGKLCGGYKNRGAELGHISIDHKGIACNCGGVGCLEAYASTSALIRQYAEATGVKEEEIDGFYLVRKFREGEEAAVKCMEEHTGYLGHGIASFINTFAPQKVVIGGGISEAGQFYIDMIKKSALSYAMPDCAANTDVVGAEPGIEAAASYKPLNRCSLYVPLTKPARHKLNENYWVSIDPSSFELPVCNRIHSEKSVCFHHKILMGKRVDIDLIATAIRKVYAHAESL